MGSSEMIHLQVFYYLSLPRRSYSNLKNYCCLIHLMLINLNGLLNYEGNPLLFIPPTIAPNFDNVSALMFSLRGICCTWQFPNFSVRSLTFFKYRTIDHSLVSYDPSICIATSCESVYTLIFSLLP